MRAILSGICLLWLSLPPGASAQENAREPLPSRQIIEEVRDHRDGTAVWWTGQAGWLIKSGGVLIGMDLVLEDAERIHHPPVTAVELAPELDIALVTHEHGDHFNNRVSRALAEHSRCTFVVPRNCLDKARKLGIPEDRIRVAVPGEAFEIKGVRIVPMRALHGQRGFAIHKNANLDDCGYLINVGGKTFLQPGDTFLLQDHLELRDVDVLFISPTEHNMFIQPSVTLINALEPDYILFQHGDTYRQTPENRFWTHNYATEAKALLCRSFQERCLIPEQGQRLIIR